AFTHPDPKIRTLALDETKRGLDMASELGCSLMTLWMGQDGFDYSFQGEFAEMWDNTILAIQEVADYDKTINISIEYKPNEPRAFSLMPDVATTLLALKEIDRVNTGITLDFAHILYADELHAFSESLVQRYSLGLGGQLNDGYGKRDNGLMVGSVHPIQTLELLVELLRSGFDGTIYFDTFPDHSGLDPVAEGAANIATTERLLMVAQQLTMSQELLNARIQQDPMKAQRIIQEALFR
ncbi:MAG: TIM barrel protein, partial [Alphaproteobacteria bacterium]